MLWKIYVTAGIVVAVLSLVLVGVTCVATGKYVKYNGLSKRVFKYDLRRNPLNILKVLVLELIGYTPCIVLLWPVRVYDWVFLGIGIATRDKEVEDAIERVSSDFND